MSRKLILLDIDGTLVGRTHHIPESAVSAVHAAQAKGHLVMICTGRASVEIEDHILQTGFDGLIAVSGAYVEVGGTVRSERFIEPDVVTSASKVLDTLGVDYVWQSSKGMWGTRRLLERLQVFTRFKDSSDAMSRWHDIDDSRRHAVSLGCGIGDVVPASKGTFLVPDDSELTLADVHWALGDDLAMVNGSMGSFAKVNGEVMIPGVTKGSALREVAELTGVPMSETVAVGDSDNDLAMLEAAGTAVAMGNGTDSVKDVADFVTGDVDEGGLYQALQRLQLL
ncbi:HAD family hydrolase [Bifidobacterium callimiconis]|uniref:Cof family hydrolase n=1 Tax=Bifidobacterium callimiconis TaxID=2306973 RepID=A0A430FBS0_9BIFI|nr:HAD family hydrolase [Bifidobacterium callimiconis]MBT1177610.1 HAD family hydrolase [Bifidobacterium callimiconis]RSX50283.1 cof family hydrolase [Bifidobacterium callimiconis]